MSGCIDNQDVGLEAATIERVRNSSLVKCSGADNVAGLEAQHRNRGIVGVPPGTRMIGRGAFPGQRRHTDEECWSAGK